MPVWRIVEKSVGLEKKQPKHLGGGAKKTVRQKPRGRVAGTGVDQQERNMVQMFGGIRALEESRRE